MQGGTSPLSGSVELMLHRRLLDDDAFGKCLGDEDDDDDDAYSALHLQLIDDDAFRKYLLVGVFLMI